MDSHVNVVIKEPIAELHNATLSLSEEKLPTFMLHIFDKKI